MLALGDSITYGQGSSGGYESPLSLALGAQDVNVTYTGVNTVYEDSALKADGFSGYMISDVAGNLTSATTPYAGNSNLGGYWLTGGSAGPVTANPNVVLLMLGTNDINIGYDPTLDPTNPYAVNEDATDFDAHMTSRLESLIGQLRTDLPNSLILVASPPPSTLHNVVWDARLADFGPDIQTMVSTDFAGQGVDYVNMYGAFETSTYTGAPGSLILDGTHPDPAGYNVMAQTWDSAIMADYIDADVPEPSTYAMVIGGLVALFGWRKFGKAKQR